MVGVGPACSGHWGQGAGAGNKIGSLSTSHLLADVLHTR